MDFIPGVDGQGIPRVLAAFMHALLADRILCWSMGGRQRRSFLYVDEFVNALLHIIDSPKPAGAKSSTSATTRTTSVSARWREAWYAQFLAQRPNARVPRLRTQTAAAFYGEGYDDSIVRIPPWPRLSACSGGARHMPLTQMLPPHRGRLSGAL